MAKLRQALILAAGESSRFWPLASDHHKSMYEICGKPILQYTTEALKRVGIRDLIIVHGPTDTAVRKRFGSGKEFGVRIRYAVQRDAKRTGMAGAIRVANRLLAEQFTVVNAGNFSCGAALQPMLRAHRGGITLAATPTKTPQLYGIFRFKGTKPVGLVEKPKKAPSNQRIIGTYILKRDFLTVLRKYRGHYALETALNAWLKAGKPTALVRLKRYPEFPLKYPWHLFAINHYLLDRLKAHRGRNVRIHPTARITGKVWLGDNVRVREYAIINGPCWIGEGSTIGTHALIRDYASLGRDVQTGFRTEIKNSLLFDDIKLHTSFVGDSILDSGCRFGATTVTANRRMDRKSIKTVIKRERIDTGMTFFGTICGKNVRTGVHTSIMPGVKLGSNATIGPNTAVMEDVPNDTLVYAKFKRTVRKRK